jgi:hypothetical protein
MWGNLIRVIARENDEKGANVAFLGIERAQM